MYIYHVNCSVSYIYCVILCCPLHICYFILSNTCIMLFHSVQYMSHVILFCTLHVLCYFILPSKCIMLFPVQVIMSISSSSSQHSMTSTPSVDLSTYQDDLENVLAWLLEAEEIVEKQEPIGNDIKKVKGQFNQHEVGPSCEPFIYCHSSLHITIYLIIDSVLIIRRKLRHD